ncbi:hypothetical protein LSAT2_021340 [Lamellibrachia satsuma]|nr:hypothetical protein LSAT2_021340 [Lamellibrachia satsuma]
MESTERVLKIQQLEDEVMALRHDLEDRDQEVRQIREKSAAEIADLEGIAQAHYSRANRLSDELNYLRAEHLEITRQLQSREEISDREHKLEDTLRELKDDIKTVSDLSYAASVLGLPVALFVYG